MQKINKNIENLSLMFYNYCIDLAEEIIETKIAYISSFDKENQKISNIKSPNSTLIVKIGHLMVNCEKILKNNMKEDFFSENDNIIINEPINQKTNFNIVRFNEAKSISLSSYDPSYEIQNQTDYQPFTENNKILENESINFD
jgi:L-ribulose-5-phosphate 3-epimerase UlaE